MYNNGGMQEAEKLTLKVRIAPQISKNEVCIYRCVRARLTAYTLLLGKLKPAKTLEKTVLKLFHPLATTTNVSQPYFYHQFWTKSERSINAGPSLFYFLK